MGSLRPPIDIDKISPPVWRFSQWRDEVAAGRTQLGFDDWLVRKLSNSGNDGQPVGVQTQKRSVRYNQARVEFELVDEGCYKVVHPTKGLRYFRCILDGDYPIIAFYRPDTFIQLPWITITRVFTSDELKSLMRVG